MGGASADVSGAHIRLLRVRSLVRSCLRAAYTAPTKSTHPAVPLDSSSRNARGPLTSRSVASDGPSAAVISRESAVAQDAHRRLLRVCPLVGASLAWPERAATGRDHEATPQHSSSRAARAGRLAVAIEGTVVEVVIEGHPQTCKALAYGC